MHIKYRACKGNIYKVVITVTIMVYLVIRKVKGIKYYYVVESARNKKGKPVQKVIEYIGSEKRLLEKLKIKTNS